MKRASLVNAVFVLMSFQAGAAEDGAAPWEDYPEREVERPLLPKKSGFRASLAVKSFATATYLDSDGKPQDTDGPYNMFVADVGLEYGIIDRLEVLAGIPYKTGEVEQTRGGDIGDLYAGAKASIYSTEQADLVLGVIASLPTGGSQYHYEESGELQNFRTGDPGYNYYPELGMRYTWKNLQARASARGIFTGEADVVYNKAGSENKDVSANPGDGYDLDAMLIYQATKRLAPIAGAGYRTVSETKLDGEGLGDESMLFDFNLGLIYQVSGDAEVSASVGGPVIGENVPLAFPVTLSVTSRF